MASIRTWLIAMRLPSVLLTLSSSLMGTSLAIWEGKWNAWVSILAAFTAIMLQIIANLANDYGDFLRGANVEEYIHPNGIEQPGFVSLRQLRTAIVWLVLFTVGTGLALLQVAGLSGPSFILLALLGVIAIIAAITYTIGRKPYGYAGWGDVSVLFFFGLLGVLGTVYLHTQQWRWAHVLPALSYGCLAVAVLNLNNIRDIKLDAQVGKKTLVVRMGRRAALYYHWALLTLGIIMAAIFTMIHYNSPWQWLFVAAIPSLVRNGIMTMRLAPTQLGAELQRLVLMQLLFVLFFSIGLVLSSTKHCNDYSSKFYY
ncbi:MAG: 1,4-dihydroxy-2-naphthoate octaprenyltransferase [Bacteroidota bacterium]